MELEDPPLAAATYARGLAGLGVRQKLNMRSAFSRTYLSTLEAEQARAIADLHAGDAGRDRVAPLPGARERLRGERAVRAAAEAPRHGDRDEGVSELLVPRRAQSRAIGARRAAVRGSDRSAGPGREGGGRRRRRRPGASFPRPDRLLVSARLPERHDRLDDAEGDRRSRLRRTRRQQRAARPRRLVPRNVRRRRDRGRQDGRPGRAARVLQRGERRLSSGREGRRGRGAHERTSATTASSTFPRRRRSAAAARPTARRSSPPSRLPFATAWTSSTSRAVGRRRIPARTS